MSDKKQKITCPHCNASRSHLRVVDEIVHHQRSRAIKCMNCGHRIPEDKSQVKPVPIKAEVTERTRAPRELIPCTACGAVKVWQNHNAVGLCQHCATRLRSWQQYSNVDRRKPGPFIKKHGAWINNPRYKHQVYTK